MENQFTKSNTLYVILVAVMTISVSCILLESEATIYDGRGYFTISPDTIIEDLLEGKEGVFIPRESSPFVSYPELGNPVQWSIQEYIFIAQSVNELIWGNSLTNWELNMVRGDWHCEYYYSGPQSAEFRLFRIGGNNEKSRYVSTIEIIPRRSLVTWHKEEHFPVILNWKNIDMNKIDISMEEAVEIAEKNGGYEARTNVKNECSITAILNPESPIYHGWIVSYRKDYGERFELYHINPKTGKIIK